MASNETVVQVVKEMRDLCAKFRDVIVARSFIATWANEVEVAHKREIAAKDAEIARLRAALKTCVDYVKCEYGCVSECDAACEEIESGCKLREWTIEFGLETLDRKGGE